MIGHSFCCLGMPGFVLLALFLGLVLCFVVFIIVIEIPRIALHWFSTNNLLFLIFNLCDCSLFSRMQLNIFVVTLLDLSSEFNFHESELIIFFLLYWLLNLLP
jgi:hypothetical protein